MFQAARPLLIWSIEANCRAEAPAARYRWSTRRDHADALGRHRDRREHRHRFEPGPRRLRRVAAERELIGEKDRIELRRLGPARELDVVVDVGQRPRRRATYDAATTPVVAAAVEEQVQPNCLVPISGSLTRKTMNYGSEPAPAQVPCRAPARSRRVGMRVQEASLLRFLSSQAVRVRHARRSPIVVAHALGPLVRPDNGQSRWRSNRRVADPNPRPETQPFIELMHARVCAAALHKQYDGNLPPTRELTPLAPRPSHDLGPVDRDA